MPSKTRRRQRPRRRRRRRTGRNRAQPREREERREERQPAHSTNPPAQRKGPFQSIGRKLGAGLGDFAGKAIGSLFGSGDYETEHAESGLGDKIEGNTLVQPMTASQVPEFGSDSELHGAVVVRHREYIDDLQTNQGFYAPNRINPSNPAMFPWLSTIAANFQQWIPLGIVFEFVSTAGNAFSGGAANLGDVNIATQYDADMFPFVTKRELLNSFYATSCATSQNLMHAVECSSADTPNTPLYVGLPAGGAFSDRLTDIGFLNILTEGSQSIYTAGQIWVTYEIILLKPRLDPLGPLKKYTVLELALLKESRAKDGNPLELDEVHQLAAELKVEEGKEQPTILMQPAPTPGYQFVGQSPRL